MDKILQKDTKSIRILFLGQFREKEYFLKELVKINNLKAFNRISELIFITDKGELNKKDILDLKKLNCGVIEKDRLTDEYLKRFDPELNNRSTGIRKRSGGMKAGTIWRQLHDLKYGLELCPDDSFVLRSRSDISIPEDFYEHILSNPSSYLQRELPSLGGFKYKIWVQWFHIFIPFYIHDTAFLGYAADLKKLISTDLNIELAKYYPTASLAVFFWVYPYSKEEIIRQWLERYSSSPFKFRFLFSAKFREILLQFYKIIYSDFKIEFPMIQWLLQWNPGVYTTRIWKTYSSKKSLLINIIEKKLISESDDFLTKINIQNTKKLTIYNFLR